MEETLMEIPLRKPRRKIAGQREEVFLNGYVLKPPTEKEIRNLFNTDSTKFVRFMGKFLQTDVHVYPKYFPYVGDCINPRTGLKGYLSDWTDEDFYNYYELTNEEISIIEKEIN